MRQQSLAFLLFIVLLAGLAPISLVSTHAEEHQRAPPTCSADRENWTMGVVFCNENATVGYTLFAPIPSKTTYLIDQEGRFVHSWTSPGNYRPSLSAYLLPDGDLLRTANAANSAVGNFSGGGTSGKLERISWDGTLEWSWEYNGQSYISHHDIEPMPNGNILLIAWEERTEEEAIQAGRNPEIASDSPGAEWHVWPDHIIEVEPVGSTQANIVWEWRAWDHLIQDFDPTKDNYGVVADHPELIDINYVGGVEDNAGRADWMHCNGIDYNPLLDQIAISCRSMHEVYIIDHSTTTEEAAGHTGGNSGRGGDVLYRWGNPQVYKKGLSSDQQLFGQHDVNWIEQGHPFAGGLSIFNNGNGRYPSFSSVEVLLPTLDNESYILEANGTFGPALANWSWNMGEAMYSSSISGVQAMQNGHMLVTHGTKGTLFEVDEEGHVVWHYINPIGSAGPYTQSDIIPNGNREGTTANQIFKATHVPADHPALIGKDLTPGDYLEIWTDLCPSEDAWGWDRNGDGCIDDSDEDGILDPVDLCPLGSDTLDLDNDSIPDACDDLVDSDQDGVADDEDACPGFDDANDADMDGLPEPCDELVDNDGDGVSNDDDLCEGQDDALDLDTDGVPDGCDPLIDNDNDGVANELDTCHGHNDADDQDSDGTPDGCDATPQGDVNLNQTNSTTNNSKNSTTNLSTPDTTTGGTNLPVSTIAFAALVLASVSWLFLTQLKRGVVKNKAPLSDDEMQHDLNYDDLESNAMEENPPNEEAVF
jgi:hypothetical protein